MYQDDNDNHYNTIYIQENKYWIKRERISYVLLVFTFITMICTMFIMGCGIYFYFTQKTNIQKILYILNNIDKNELEIIVFKFKKFIESLI
jgi:uncharacterized BrkB/YihY/UPF0761 family membrane protein